MKRIMLFVLICLSMVKTAYCGMDNFKIGFTPKYLFLSIDDPDGPADDYSGFQPGGLGLIYSLDRHSRIMCDLTWIDFEVDATTTKIANTVKGYLFATSYQRIFRVNRNIDLWFGAGVILSKVDFESRYTVTGSGYLDTAYEDRTDNSLGACANISNEWALSDDIDLSLDVAYRHIFGDSVSGLSCGLSLYYKFGGR